jgi:predicted nucleotidyltransferase
VELKAIAKSLITRHHSHHYLGFAATQWKLFQKENPPRVKPLLYVFRVILTGIHLMRTGEINANLVELNETFKLPYVLDLVARKTRGVEQSTLGAEEMARFEPEFTRLIAQLETEAKETRLREEPESRAVTDLDELLKRVRLAK